MPWTSSIKLNNAVRQKPTDGPRKGTVVRSRPSKKEKNHPKKPAASCASTGDARRAVQSAELGARRFRRKLSATAVLLSALEPGRWYLRNEIRAASELPEGALNALLSRTLFSRPAYLERAPNPSWDGVRGSLRPQGADTSAELRSQWRYRLTDVGETTRAQILADPTKWTARARWKMGLENARAVPQPHSRLGRSFYGLAGSGRS